MKRYSETYNSLFRSKAKERMTGMAEIDDYLHRLTLSGWIYLICLVSFLGGVFVWMLVSF